MFKEIEDMKKRDDIFGRLWNGSLEIRTSLADIDEFKDDKNAEVFVFAQDSAEQRKKIKSADRRHIAFINENAIHRTRIIRYSR